jgi:hypothetical protein
MRVARQVRLPDVVAPDDEDIRLPGFLGGHIAEPLAEAARLKAMRLN